MNTLPAIPDTSPELRAAVSRCIDAVSSHSGWLNVLYAAVLCRIKIRRYAHIACRNSDIILNSMSDVIEGKAQPYKSGMDACGKWFLEISERHIAHLQRMHNEDSQLVNLLNDMRRSGLGLQAWILRPVQHYCQMLAHRQEQFEEMAAQIREHWPWLDEERIRAARKEYAERGGIELAELLQDGPS